MDKSTIQKQKTAEKDLLIEGIGSALLDDPQSA